MPSTGNHQALSNELREFVESHAGRIDRSQRSEGGASRITWLINTVQRDCVLRVDPGDGPVANTPLNLQREATVYRALAGSGVRIPRLIAERNDALLMEMASGTPDLDQLSREARERVIDDYVDALADLHLTRVTSALNELDPPADAGQAAQHNVKLWEGIFRSRVRRPSPLAELATVWLLQRAPTSAERLVICHGDVGPGNFMHDGARVTAMLDWEFVHIGDPMDDLAWLAFRGHHFGGDIGDFSAQLSRWQQRTGYAVDKRRIEYYRIMVMYTWLISCLAALDNGARNQNRFTYLNLISLLNVILPRAMMSYDGLPLPPEAPDLEPQANELAEQLDALVGLIGLSWPASDRGRMQLEMMAGQIHRLAQLSDAITEQNRSAVAKLLGTPLTDAEYQRAFADWIAASPTRSEAALGVIYSNGLRRIQADQALRPIADKPFLEL